MEQEQPERGYRWWHWVISVPLVIIAVPAVIFFLIGRFSARARPILTPLRVWIVSAILFVLIMVVSRLVEDRLLVSPEPIPQPEIAAVVATPTVRSTFTQRPVHTPTVRPVPTARPTPRPEPTARPTAASPGLGVSRNSVQSAFEHPEIGFTFDSLSFGASGFSPDDFTLVELLGSGELESAAIYAEVSGGRAQDAFIYLKKLRKSPPLNSHSRRSRHISYFGICQTFSIMPKNCESPLVGFAVESRSPETRRTPANRRGSCT